jgi:hypothetical protein
VDVGEMLEDMQHGVIEESDSSQSSLVIIVQKKNWDLCFSIGYR